MSIDDNRKKAYFNKNRNIVEESDMVRLCSENQKFQTFLMVEGLHF